jgi:hypothetical protein
MFIESPSFLSWAIRVRIDRAGCGSGFCRARGHRHAMACGRPRCDEIRDFPVPGAIMNEVRDRFSDSGLGSPPVAPAPRAVRSNGLLHNAVDNPCTIFEQHEGVDEA